MSSRSIKDLSSEMRDKAAEWEIKMLQAGIDYLITCTRRTIEEQKSLYADRINTQKLFTELTEQQKQLESTLSSTEVFEAQIKAKNELKEKAEQTFNEYVETSSKEIDGIEAEISRLQRQLVNKKEEVETKRLSYKIVNKFFCKV